MLRINSLSIVFILTLGIFSPSPAAAEDIKSWRGSAQVESAGNHSYKTFFLTPEVYRAARPDLADLRLIDRNNHFVPYLLVQGFHRAQNVQTEYTSQICARFVKRGDAYFDFQINPLQENQDIAGNQLHLELPAVNFLKNVSVYGGYDGNTWEYLQTDQIYRVDDLFKDRVNLGSCLKYNYYRFVILKNTEEIAIRNLRLIRDDSRNAWQPYQRSASFPFKVVNRRKETIISIANPNRLKLKRIRLAASGNFRRSYQVYDDPVMERMIHSGELYHLSLENFRIAQTDIVLDEEYSAAPVIRVKIFNHDDAPLDIVKIRADYEVDQVNFEGRRNSNYRLLFGNRYAEKPFYDLDTYQPQILNEPMDRLRLSGYRQSGAIQKASILNVNLNLILNIVIGAITILLIVFLIGKLNKQH